MCRDRFFQVPLDHARGVGGPEIQVFVREVVLAKNEGKELPVLLYLQGGPGFPSKRPSAATGGWIGEALKEHRLLLLDQRGTGRSTPVTAQSMQGLSPAEQASYLTHFRADSIVRDCEVIRQALGLEKIDLLGQSFGGFCVLTYLSFFPSSVRVAYTAGGLGPVLRSADEVYRKTYKRVLTRNKRYYERYPADVRKVREIVAHLEAKGGVPLPGGGRLTPRRFLSLGLGLGMGSGIEAMHWLVESAFLDVAGERQLDYRFLKQVEAEQSFDTNPIFWMMHETIYCGPSTGSSRWSAHRMLQEEPFSTAFDYRAALADPQKPPLMFTGEMVYPWFAEDFETLPALREAAELLAEKEDWGPLYDVETLRNSTVPVAAAVYYEDMYVELAYSEEVADLLGKNCRVWVTNEFQHSGIRDEGARVLGTLMAMAKGEKDIPS